MLKPSRWIVALLALIALSMAADVYSDLRDGARLSHVGLEVVAMGAAFVGAVVVWRGASKAWREATASLATARLEAQRFREEARDALSGLALAIDRQFARWELTAAEREVGLLLLKGLSHREIAEARETSENTVRQQALGLYRKSGLGGRAELAAFFLEDLMLPRHPAGAPAPDAKKTP